MDDCVFHRRGQPEEQRQPSPRVDYALFCFPLAALETQPLTQRVSSRLSPFCRTLNGHHPKEGPAHVTCSVNILSKYLPNEDVRYVTDGSIMARVDQTWGEIQDLQGCVFRQQIILFPLVHHWSEGTHPCRCR